MSELSLSETEAEKIVSVGVLLRKFVLKQQPQFKGSFGDEAATDPVLPPLLTLIDVLLEGPDAISERRDNERARMKVAYLISQLIITNSSRRSSDASLLYQMKERETPFPLYIGLKLHSYDRMKTFIMTLHQYGLSVSYDRVMEVRKSFAEAVTKRWSEDGVVVPTTIKKGVFVTGAVDNIDESGRVELHGTAISMTSHCIAEKPGCSLLPLSLLKPTQSPVDIPEEFGEVPFVQDLAGDVFIPPSEEGVHDCRRLRQPNLPRKRMVGPCYDESHNGKRNPK